jgi:hypothetical protein
MSTNSILAGGQRRVLKWAAVLLLTAALTGLPVLATQVPDPLSNLFAQPVQAGDHQGAGGG